MTDQPQTPPTQQPPSPGDRLRRILDASEEAARAEEEAARDVQRIYNPSAEPPAAWYGDEPTLPVNAAPATEPAEPSLPPEERHPTGVPDQTGGWYAESWMDAPQDVPADQDATRPSLTPADMAATRPSMTPADLAATRPSQVPADMEVTRPSLGDLPTRSVPNDRGQAAPPPIGALPERVSETDTQATRVTRVAYRQTHPTPPPAASRPVSPPPSVTPRPVSMPATPARPRKGGWKRAWGCLLRVFILLLFAAALIAVIGASFGVYKYYTISRSLPSIDDLRSRASQFETTRILDRNNNVIYQIVDPNAGLRTYVTLDKISPYLIAATVATEDKEFYNHPGFDLFAIARAFWQNYTNQEIVSGASTITQQLARILLMTPEERYEQSFERKTREIVLAAEITRRYSKDEILELYINEINYGNFSYGIEAAAESYFHTSAANLSFGQATFLAGLPQSPLMYDVFTNREASLARHRDVLTLMYYESEESGCIYVSNSPDRVCASSDVVTQALVEIQNYPFQQATNQIQYPHWVDYIRAQLENQYDPQTIYRSGFTVYTTLDPALQTQAEQMVKEQTAALADRNVQDGALVAVRPATGEILAMVGSADYYNDAIAGQVNMAVTPRQPGSSIKPFTYLAAFEKGWTASTLLWDVPTDFPASNDPNDPNRYSPLNYDGRFHGPVTVRSALANSYNIPAVSALSFVGIYDSSKSPQLDGLVPYMQRLGVTSLDRNDYGLALTLGGGDVSLLQMTGAYAALANNGQRVPPVSITRIVDAKGNVVFEYQLPAAQQVIRPEHAYIMSSILSDNEARAPMFGSNSILNLPFAAAVKTGTTNDYRDNWTVGYTPDLVTGVWFGNADYTPMINTSGVSGAAPVWAQFMQFAVPLLTGGNPTPFTRPAGIVDRIICAESGTEPSQWCSQQRSEIFAYDQLPPNADEDLWQEVKVDTWTGLRASNACADFTDDKLVLNVANSYARTWIQGSEDGRAWAERLGFGSDELFFTPERECNASDPRPELIFAGLNDGQTITTTPFDIYVVAYANGGFRRFKLEYGLGDDPASWEPLVENVDTAYRNPERIITWDLTSLPPGRVTLRLYMESDHDTYAERRIHLGLQVPTATPTPSPTPTLTPTPTTTWTPMPTPTPEFEKTLEPTTVPVITLSP